ncbi:MULTISPECIES: hypothetical protein [Nocardia]|uniref:IrrE N-terminal-like domain-containing protein n=1 Tax=Nocardia sputorum TaxID=2984338 RepID=A0ABM8D1A9_9NOCA|nr:hypothetical protein [Nocardia sputorum]BDT92516.1 hypothetical protein IFM12275_24920 [Nocardia sputorum]BDU01087.1 hypothetical protein IFM12276_41150 [Nocardia sputorum]
MEDLAARFEELGRLVQIPHPWDMTEYIERVAAYRGRSITLCPIDVGALAGNGCGTGSGLWIAREDDDVIMYGADTEWHADHIIAHEIGHMLLGHGETSSGPAGPATDLPLRELMPSLSLETIHSVLGRQDYGSERERAAETFADLLLVEAMLPKRSASRFRSTFFRNRHR